MIRSLLVVGVLFVLLYPTVLYEENRFQHHFAACHDRNMKNAILLRSEVCTDSFLKYELDGEHVGCSRAARENQMGVFRCAATEWWRTGEVVGVYNRILGSQWMLLALILPTLLYTISKIAGHYNERAKEKTFFQEKRSFLKMIAGYSGEHQLIAREPPMLLQHKKHRKKVRSISRDGY